MFDGWWRCRRWMNGVLEEEMFLILSERVTTGVVWG